MKELGIKPTKPAEEETGNTTLKQNLFPEPIPPWSGTLIQKADMEELTSCSKEGKGV